MIPYTLIATNRNLTNNKDKYVFGNQLDPNGEVHWAKTSLGINRKDNSLKPNYGQPVTIADVDSELAGVQDNGLPWVVFINGNNQSMKKNLKKSARIQAKYGVNMLIFSWPSRSYNPHFLLRLIGAGALASINARLAYPAIKSALSKRIKQYREARKIAEASVPHVKQVLELAIDKLFNRLNGVRKTVLVHSLGNYLFERLVLEGGTLDGGAKFDAVLLHQPDVDAAEHHRWIEQIQLCEDDGLYITHNHDDAVLRLSGIVNTMPELSITGIEQASSNSRLGNRPEIEPKAVNANYIDFTDMKGVQLEHGIAWSKHVGDEVYNRVKNVLC